METPRLDEVSQEYAKRMAELRQLDEQGDGMRSFMGQLLPIVTGAYKVVIIDEPEAFLHPPQAHALGEELGRLSAENGIQVIVATHDRSFLTGLLNSGTNVSVVRLTRSDGPAQMSQLNSDDLRELWADPVLKYSNVLDGLFHRIVVLAEAERDCAYLAAAVDVASRSNEQIPQNEILFVPTGGKDGMAKVAKALSSVKVPVIAAPDVDMLDDKMKLEQLVKSLGGEWTTEMAELWDKATADLDTSREGANVGQVLDAICGVLGARREEPFSEEHKKDIRAHTRTKDSPWSAVGELGLHAFKGRARAALVELFSLLEKEGVVLIQVGALEQLAPEVTERKGPGWLRAALEKNEHANNATQAHVKRILEAGQTKMQLKPVELATPES